MTLSDDVRSFCKKQYIDTARANGDKTVTIRSGDVHASLNYKNRCPLVCSAIGSNKFEELCKIRRLSIDGPINGMNTIFIFELL